jgi:hypothetical protein
LPAQKYFRVQTPLGALAHCSSACVFASTVALLFS